MNRIVQLIVPLICILVLGLIVLWPSFNLAYTGDDYLSYRRFSYSSDNIKYFLTDYGPQDTYITAVIKTFGSNPIYSYLISFIFRGLAAICLIPMAWMVTRKMTAAWIAAMFFTITTSGLETTNWSFNAPSYLAIGIMGLFVFVLVRYRELKGLILSGLLLVLAMIVQPIRMTFMPLLAAGIEVWLLALKPNPREAVGTITRILVFGLLTALVIKVTNVGGSIGVRENGSAGQMFQEITTNLRSDWGKTLLSPIQQLGSVIIPTTIINATREEWGMLRTFKRIAVVGWAGWLGLCIGLKILRPDIEYRNMILIWLLGGGWIAYAWARFMIWTAYPLQPTEIMGYMVGGLFTLVLLALVINTSSRLVRLGLGIAGLVMIAGFIAPWVRNPGFFQITTSRYLIVSGAGLAVFVGVLWGMATSRWQRIAVLCGIVVLWWVHANASFTYLHHLQQVRDVRTTERLRSMIPRVNGFGNPPDPVVFYFEGDAEKLYHTFLFGFGEIMGFQYKFKDVYNLVATADWQEVVSAYTDGEALKRFFNPASPARLENIYAYRLEGDNLIDITQEKRQILLKLERL